MTFQESVRTCLTEKYFFRFQGRASRSEFWWFMLFIAIVNILTGVTFSLLPPRGAMLGSLIVSMLLLPANLGANVRRFHDRNLSGWWLLLPIGLLFLSFLAGVNKAGGSVTLIAALSLAMCVGYLAILCMPSQSGANRYGPPPEDAPRCL